MKCILMMMLCAFSASVWADEAFDKDVAYCAGLSASLLSVHPEDANLEKAVNQLAQMVEDNKSTMDVEDSRATAQAYTVVLQQVRGSVPDHENERLAALVDMGLKSCKRIGVDLFPE